MKSRKLLTLSFIKMHGLGNDFVVIDGLLSGVEDRARQKKLFSPKLVPRVAKQLCDRRFGVGADQILWIQPPQSKEAIARMEVLNADGSTAEMCGNGIRAVVLYLDRELPKNRRKKVYPIETGAGLLSVEIEGEWARVNMGTPGFGGAKVPGQAERLKGLSPQVSNRATQISFVEVSMGNPHAVIFVEDPWKYPVAELGVLMERHPRFPKRTNIEFVRAESKHLLVTRVWERGAGLTLACGTGACAAAVAAILNGKCESPVDVKLPGGTLRIEWSGGNGKRPGLVPVFMSGPAREVFRGEWTTEII